MIALSFLASAAIRAQVRSGPWRYPGHQRRPAAAMVEAFGVTATPPVA